MKKPNQCSMARHLSLAEQGVWAQIERLVNAAYFRKINKGKQPDEWEYPTLHATLETLANACNVSISTIQRHLKSFIDRKMLTPQGEQFRRPEGTWSERVYRVELHDSYAVDHPCPSFIDEPEKNSNPFPKKKNAYPDDYVWNVYDDKQEGFTFQEIAKRSGIPKTQVYRLYKRALEMIGRSQPEERLRPELMTGS
jgi:hypothetical protein